MSPRLEFRNHMLAASMNGRWETLSQIISGVRRKYGNGYAPIDARAMIQLLATDGVHRLMERPAGARGTEYRLFVRTTQVKQPPRRQKDFVMRSYVRA
jgi:hypothetical protein